MNVLARNIMSYSGSCRQNFTAGQVGRADVVTGFFLNDYYLEALCGNLVRSPRASEGYLHADAAFCFS
jgi:hypothetical protein